MLETVGGGGGVVLGSEIGIAVELHERPGCVVV